MFLYRLLRTKSQLRSSLSLVRGCQSCKEFHTGAPKRSEHWKPFLEFPASSSEFEYDAFTIAMAKKRKLEFEHFEKTRKHREIPARVLIEGSNEEVLEIEVAELLRQAEAKSNEDRALTDTADSDATETKGSGTQPVEAWTEYEVDIVSLSSTGDGLGYTSSKDHVLVVPFSVPGDKVIAKVYRTFKNYSQADFVKLVTASPTREGTTPQCKYFSECGGCQLQMISYEDQLAHKKTIVEKAFRHFSGLPSTKVPAVLDTMGSPRQYGYRTKLSPHFSYSNRRKHLSGEEQEPPRIGYNRKGQSRVMDIEQCPIGTDILNKGMTIERAKVLEAFHKYKRGATLLLRESTIRQPTIDSSPDADAFDLSKCDFDAEPTSTETKTLRNGQPEMKITYPTYIDRKTYVSDMSGLSTEYIGEYKFVNRAGSFFQNNNSILRPFTSYVRDQVNPTTKPDGTPSEPNQIKYLLDAYCGSGLFTITLSPLFSSALGIDIDRRGIEAARLNAEANNIPNAGFIDADASDLFADVPYPPDQSLVVIDPPRRGASEDFLRQLCQFRAKRVIYVSCNVHSQARDVGMIVRGFDDVPNSCRYEIETLRGFDFFPQTGHVEGVCVLNRVDKE